MYHHKYYLKNSIFWICSFSSISYIFWSDFPISITNKSVVFFSISSMPSIYSLSFLKRRNFFIVVVLPSRLLVVKWWNFISVDDVSANFRIWWRYPCISYNITMKFFSFLINYFLLITHIYHLLSYQMFFLLHMILLLNL